MRAPTRSTASRPRRLPNGHGPSRATVRGEILLRAPLPPLWALALALAGCGGAGTAELRLVGKDAEARRVLVLRGGREDARAELALLRAALDLAGALGRTRPGAEGAAHFEGGGGGYLLVAVVRADGLGLETWRLDRSWVLRELPNGALVCREGDIGAVVSSLGLLLR
jgi:hypothetical protein